MTTPTIVIDPRNVQQWSQEIHVSSGAPPREISFGYKQRHIWELGASKFLLQGVQTTTPYVDPYWIEFLVCSFDCVGLKSWRLQVQCIVSVVGNTMKQNELRDDVLQRPKGILASYGKIRGRFLELFIVHFRFHVDDLFWTFMVAHAIGDVITGELVEPDVVASSSPSVGGLLDSLTGSIGISSISVRAKPVAAPVAAPTASGTAITGVVLSDPTKTSSKPADKDALRTFLTSSMPFGTPLDLDYMNISAIKVNGFSSSDMPSSDLKQPAWKPYLYKGKQRILFTVHETVYAAMYDRDEIPDVISISGQVNCRAELEGLPDISFPMMGLNTAHLEVLSFHPCAQVSEQGVDKQAMMFSPPLGNFSLMCYQATCGLGPPIQGFYQLSMFSEDEGAFLFKLHLMEGYKNPLSMEFCTLTMPFPTRRVVSFDGNPSIGTVSSTEHSLEWKIITNGRGISGKSIEATFPGSIRFSPIPSQRQTSISRSVHGSIFEEDSDMEPESYKNMVNIDEYLMEKMNKDLLSVDLEEPFSWQAYNYAKVSFKIIGGTLSGMSIDPKSVTIYPSVKAPVEISTQDLRDCLKLVLYCIRYPGGDFSIAQSALAPLEVFLTFSKNITL
ncbi:hypothetical protein GIB67_041417 [Kingdonia uniflora]|uniref:MHD domain-containing protein n=1 Tax=Kingdonia uniflora TaxID=39325 RepID=A0A7J7LRP4_9MAGN|nr:hypothetical protein GIB67_041417 [Kingdonia uniflora]